ncbi:HAD family hydrolase [Variovorax sp. UMC13]|uniref:KdsC family phosphatase n=1 Tax=Variovorax sp. UMC13 TaxID=1862326 RepID=UPI001603E5FB|nr:HAD hydrolase family protein [Variovorax sp. UMC13]MBB1604188.1 3-deoxy-D-manno-octulosonate 8-phosphate phosphatase [Variovorax sp. UMC13]
MTTARFTPETLLAAQDVRIAFFDIDGVLTDGGVFFSEDGETLKRFSILDGYGLKLLRKAGIEPAVITGRDSKPLRVRLEALGIVHVRYGTEDKLPAAEAMLAQLGFSWAQAAAIGDDWPDLPVLGRAGFAAAPPNAHVEVRARVHHVTTARGGEGAAREFCDLLLTAGGHYRRLLDAVLGPAA